MSKADELYDNAMRTRDQGDLPGAVAILQGIIAEEPTHALSHSGLAVMLQKLGKPEEAIAHALKVTELEPDDPFSFTQLSVICQRCGRIQAAEDALAKARTMQGGHRH